MTTVADGDQKLLTQPSNIAGPPSKALVAGDAISDSRNGINFLSTAARALTFLLDALAKVANLFTWPIALLVAVLLFLEPLQRVANILPQKLEQSNEFALSGLTFKIQEKARAQGNEELAKALSGLSREAMRELLRLGDDPSIVVQVVLGSSGKKRGTGSHLNLTHGENLKQRV